MTSLGKFRRTRRLVPVLVVVGVLSAAGLSWGFFTSAGSGTGLAHTGSLATPSGVVGNPSGASVAVSWTGVTDPGSGTFGYYVIRTPYPSGTPVDVCGSSPTSLLAATPTSCNDTSVPNGTYTYTITAVYRSFSSSAGSGLVTVAVAPTASAPGVSATTTYVSNGTTWVNNENVSLSDSPSTNGGPAVTSVSYYYCLGTQAPCTKSNSQLIGTATMGGSWVVTWTRSNLPADSIYDVVAIATNSTSLQSPFSSGTGIGIDTTAPNVSTPSVNGDS